MLIARNSITKSLKMFFVSLHCTLLLAIFVNAAPISEDYDILEEDSTLNDGEFGEYFEGDMFLTPGQESAITEEQGGRNGLRGVTKRWPEHTVVYSIVDDDFDEDQVQMIEDGLADLANNSCITFRKQKGDEHAVIIQGSANGCFSSVGYNKANDSEETHQVLNLAKGCFKHGTIVHEMLHTLGFYHMQSTYDRDEYVEIVWENIKEGFRSQMAKTETLMDSSCPYVTATFFQNYKNYTVLGTEHNFAKYNNDTVTDFGVPYDYHSVMHYPELAFSKNGNKTIIPLQEGVVIGQRKGLSENDVLKLNKMYCE